MSFDAKAFKNELIQAGARVEEFLGRALRERGIPAELLAAMEYSLLAGGKRVRPVLCLSSASLLGLAPEAALPFACGLELIHTYSLIHDDLPAMDDDDLRRGKPSSHKQFGEALAILAGDGLLTEAFTLMAEAGASVPAQRVLAALAEVARSAGGAGMVGGQVLDMACTGRSDVPLDQLQRMHALKTGALITCACASGALLAGAGDADVARMREYGAAVGMAFQIVDDILDETGDEASLGKPVGSDREQGKTTYPALLGLDRSRELAAEQVERAVASLAPFSGPDAVFLADLARYILHRAQ